ncbi:hypothetical protein [Nocardia sp. NPDC052566]|uniref:hypothetical protein n=1 Tax=Nocardia sp. NPDC052566 TaxID=3364330 RepID=UPI0037C842ED
MTGLLDRDLTPLSDDDVVAMVRELEQHKRMAVALEHRLYVEVSDRSIPGAPARER